jgi:hypothetical protein
MTPCEEEQFVEAIEQAVKNCVTATRSTKPCTCAVCGSEIAIGTPVIELPVRWAVCADCFELYTICASPRPME